MYQVDIKIWQVAAELCQHTLKFKFEHTCIISAIFYHDSILGIEYRLLLIQQSYWKSNASAINNFNVIIMDESLILSYWFFAQSSTKFYKIDIKFQWHV